MSILNREIMISRTVIGDEKGLLVSIPFPVFYKYCEPISGNVNMEVLLTNPIGRTNAIFYFGLIDKTFIILDAAGNVCGQETDFSVVSTTKNLNTGKKYAFALHIKADPATQCLQIYDGFYYANTDPSCESFNKFKYDFLPCYLLGIQCGYRDERLDEISKPENPHTQLIIDRFTGIINGVVAEDDVLYTKHNQIIVRNDDLIGFDEEVRTVAGLILKYRYKDGKLVPVDPNDEKYKIVRNLKDKIEKLRHLQIESSKWVIDDMLYNKLYSIRKVQRFLRPIVKEINLLQKQISEIQSKIRQTKVVNYVNNRKEYIDKHEFKYYVSICLLIKDENDYLEEWLDHYANMGIDHFYIYDNGSKIPIENTVKRIAGGKYIEKCTIVPFLEYNRNMQYECYEKCLSDHGEESRWIAFLDTDEFVDIYGKNIHEFLKEFESSFCVWFPWEQYNADKHILKVKGKMIDSFKHRIKDPFGLWGKVFLQPYRTSYMYVHLGMGLDEDERVVNVDHKDHLGEYVRNFDIAREGFLDELYSYGKIRHYFTRSFEEWINKIKRGSSDPNFKRKLGEFFAYNPELEFMKEDPTVKGLLETKQGYT